jgi:cytochrome c oxidase subunit 2
MNDGVNHFRRFAILWFVASAIMTPIVVVVLAPGMPPGNGSVQASGQVFDNTVLLGITTPIALAVVLYLIYAIWAFRERNPDGPIEDGPPVRGNATIQAWWLAVTLAVVLFLAGFGSFELLADGAGGGQGPNPIAVPAAVKTGPVLQVQVIAQQWQFDYRYPAYGGVETNQLELPTHTTIEFHVTSLDVIHSFWAYQLAVKADANPGEDNIAYVTTKGPLKFEVRCAELCGVWHGYMYNGGSVVPKSQFVSWVEGEERSLAPATKSLPPYAKQYFPAPTRRGG